MSRLSPELLRIVRLDELLQNVADSEQIACMVIDEFLVHYEPQLTEISRAIELGDLSVLAQAAHRLKGSVSAVSAASATTGRAAAMEMAALHGDLDAVRREFSALAPRIATLAEALRAWRAGRAR
ncbi:MAG TPA: Hpt domain-containing protein [Polyangiales bacterium]|nr:Hpt domain-containing protein [Polyangiales bacterium]